MKDGGPVQDDDRVRDDGMLAGYGSMTAGGRFTDIPYSGEADAMIAAGADAGKGELR